MKTKGRFHGISRDVDGELVLSFRVFEEKKVLHHLDEIKADGTIQITAEKVKTSRSLSANAFYWALCGQLAARLGISSSRMHNLLLRRYGALEAVDGEELICFIPDTEKAEETALEADTYHIKPTSATKTFKDGSVRRMYKVLKGSHTYTTKEMSTLINGIVDECNHAGIPTATPEEVKEMMQRYEKHYSRQ